MVICGGIAGTFVAQARTWLVAFAPKSEPKPKPDPVSEFVSLPGRGTDADVTNTAPPSPVELSLTINAAPSRARKGRKRPGKPRPRRPNAPGPPGPREGEFVPPN